METTEPTTTTTEAPLFYKTIDNDSRETHLNQSASDHNTWHIFTDDPYWIRRLDKVGELVRETGQGREYKLQGNQVIVRAIPKKRVLTDEQREAIGKRFKAARDAQSPDFE
jgi:hypothetical protein